MFNLFKYRLKFVPREDDQQLAEFKTIVNAIHQQITDFQNWLKNGFPVEPEIIEQMTTDQIGLRTFIDMYFKNKFSSPASAAAMWNNIDELCKEGRLFCETINDLVKTRTAFEKITKGDPSNNTDELNPEEAYVIEHADELFTKTIETGGYCLKVQTFKILHILSAIHRSIEPDMMRIAMGIDVVRQYYKNKKIKSVDPKMETKFTIKMIAVSKADRDFIEKEKTNNERTKRNDGGSDGTDKKV